MNLVVLECRCLADRAGLVFLKVVAVGRGRRLLWCCLGGRLGSCLVCFLGLWRGQSVAGFLAPFEVVVCQKALLDF